MELRYYAEHGVDEYIRRDFFPDLSYKGVMVEVGGATPHFLSMSRHFKETGWRTVVIEPNPAFADLQRREGNEVYEMACGEMDRDDVDFTIVSQWENTHQHQHTISDHGYSSFFVKEAYKDLDREAFDKIPKKIIQVKCRRLDTIIDLAKIETIDFLSVDVEGWELEVMRGLTKIKPKIVVLENVLHDADYMAYMTGFGYELNRVIDINYVFLRRGEAADGGI